jgi:hypothetical protein
MSEPKLTREQKEILLAVLCQTSTNEDKLADLSDQVLLDSDLQMDLQTATFSMNTAKVRLLDILVQ